jgi:phosphate transport system permease protein
MATTDSNAPARSQRGLGRGFEIFIESVIKMFGWSTILIVTAILGFMIYGACPLLYQNDWWTSLTTKDWHPKADHGATPQFGILAMVVGNLSVALLAMLIAIPLGLAAAVYISEFATGRTKEWLKVVIEGLAAVPSIVWGFIGISILGPFMIDNLGAKFGTNLLNGGIILGLMSIPLIVSLAEDALRAVPDAYREAALALGANKWEIVYKVLFPAGKTGIMAACMLGVGRAVGETMAVLLATGNRNLLPSSLFDPITTLTAIIASEMGDVSYGGQHYQALFMLGVVLLLFTGAINLTAQIILRRSR